MNRKPLKIENKQLLPEKPTGHTPRKAGGRHPRIHRNYEDQDTLLPNATTVSRLIPCQRATPKNPSVASQTRSRGLNRVSRLSLGSQLDSSEEYQPPIQVDPIYRRHCRAKRSFQGVPQLSHLEETALLSNIDFYLKCGSEIPSLVCLVESLTQRRGVFTAGWAKSFLQKHRLEDLVSDRRPKKPISQITKANQAINAQEMLRGELEILGEKQYDTNTPLCCIQSQAIVQEEFRPPVNVPEDAKNKAQQYPSICINSEADSVQMDCQVEEIFLSDSPPIDGTTLPKLEEADIPDLFCRTEEVCEDSNLAVELNEEVAVSESTSNNRRSSTRYRMLSKAQKQRLVKLSYRTSITTVARKYNISINNICRWRKSCERKLGAGRKISNPQMEQQLIKWVLDTTAATGNRPSRSEIQRQARSISNSDDFKASKGWYERFISRNKFLKHKSSSQKFQDLLVGIKVKN